MIIAGLLIALGERRIGPMFLIFVMIYLMVLQDYALINDLIKPAPKTKSFKYSDLTRHISVIGGALFIMATPAPIVAAPNKKEKKKN